MSFILDALKKSETDRQQQGAAEFAGVPASSGPTRAPRWLWILGLLLAINLAVLLGLLIKPGTRVASVDVEASPPPAADIDKREASPPPAVDIDTREAIFAERVAEARRNAPRREEPAPAVPPPMQAEQAAPAMNLTPAPEVAEQTSRETAALPTFIEVLTNGTIQLPELRIDIHVYSEVPEDRFVFINMSKQREQSQLSEGPVVEKITPNGVVLNYQGTQFFLPRD